MNVDHAWRGLARTTLVLGCLTCGSGLAGAATVIDGPGGFIPSFTGTQSPDIDILSASLNLSGTNLLFSATLNGTIGNAADTYVLGINRGLSTRNFSAVGLPGVTFDSVLTVTGVGVLGGNDFVTATGISAPFQINGSNITAVIPLSILPIVGSFTSADQFLWNFWTRGSLNGVAVAGNAGLADFAPDSSDASVTPLPAALPLFASGGGLLGFLGWRRKRKQAAIS
jgi:hypothetical protein